MTQQDREILKKAHFVIEKLLMETDTKKPVKKASRSEIRKEVDLLMAKKYGKR